MPYKDKEEQKRWRLTNATIIKEYRAQYHHDNRDIASQQAMLSNRSIKFDVFAHYGLQCALCSENRLGALNIDHISGGGNQHFQQLQKYGSQFYRWLKGQGFPAGYRTLCANCNHREYINSRQQPIHIARRDRHLQRKRGVLTILGGEFCIICGCTDLDVLTVEHPNNDGAEHRRELDSVSSTSFYRALLKYNDFGRRLMVCYCRSCNSDAISRLSEAGDSLGSESNVE